MLVSIFLALLLPSAGMTAVFVIYLLLLWIAGRRHSSGEFHTSGGSMKPAAEKGLSAAELDNLPKVTGKDLVMGNECAVCLDEIESHEFARMLPVCHHGFHLQCADTWLSKHSACPICRAKLEPQLFKDDNPC